MSAFDISKSAFIPQKHFAGTGHQQGRIITDDDLNENERIHNEDMRRSRVDIIGGFGSPDAGFLIENARLNKGKIDFTIHNGSLYLGGLRLEMDALKNQGKLETYLLQKDWLDQTEKEQKPLNPNEIPTVGQFDLVYLEAWQQDVCAVEDASLFEVALGGPDTTTRIRNMRRVKLARNIGFSDCADAWQTLTQDWEAKHFGKINEQFERIRDAHLTVDFDNSSLPEDLCTPSVIGGYLGAENQAIRVQLTDSGTFTWGFDNASPLYRVTAATDSNGITHITMLTQPKDQNHYPLSGQVVEILPWSAVLSNGEKVATQSGFLSKVTVSYDSDTHLLSLSSPIPTGFGEEWKSRDDKSDLETPQYHAQEKATSPFFYMRVWDRQSDTTSPAEIPFTVGKPITLGNTGLTIKIEGTDLLKEDYWIIAARPDTPQRVVPWELETGMPPLGVRRFFAPLAIIKWSWITRQETLVGEVIHDCRKTFRPLTDQECCCTYTVGDGIHSKGDYNTIEEAVRNLPEDGGKVCVLRGIHQANVLIRNRKNIRITGCGEHSLVQPHQKLFDKPLFTIQGCENIEIDNLTLVAIEGTAIQVTDAFDNKSVDSVVKSTVTSSIHIHHNDITALTHAIIVYLNPAQAGKNDIWIDFNIISMLDKEGGKAAIFSLADGVLIERNKIGVVPNIPVENPSDPTKPPKPPFVFDPCPDRNKLYGRNSQLRDVSRATINYIKFYSLIDFASFATLATGGIQIGGTSENVKIRQNDIVGGSGNGITLGHLPADLGSGNNTATTTGAIAVSRVPTVNNNLYEIAIEDNLILKMGLSGIGAAVFTGVNEVTHVEELVIFRNTIRFCAKQLPELKERKSAVDIMGFGGISLVFCDNATIQENRIAENGLDVSQAVCGIFILHGQRIDVSNNQIINNGTIDKAGKKGQRGGIVIKMSIKDVDWKTFADNPTPFFDGTPAVRVHNNIVLQPVGHALFIIAMGPISVIGNQMTAQAIDVSNPYSLLAGSVFILNLGISKDLLLLFYLANLQNTAHLPPLQAKAATLNPALLTALQYLPNGKTLVVGNQTTLDLRSTTKSIAISSQCIVSLDDVGFNSNETECAGFFSTNTPTLDTFLKNTPTVDFVLFNTFLAAFSVRANDNRFTEGFTLNLFSLLSLGYMNTAASNQSTHCLIVVALSPAHRQEQLNTVLFDVGRCIKINAAYQALLK